MKRIITIIMMMLSLVSTGDNVLLWMFDDPDIIELDGSRIKAEDLIGRGQADGKGVNAVRVATVDSDGNKLYLDLFDRWDTSMENGYGDFIRLPTEFITQNDYLAGPAFADLTGLNLDDTGRMFMMEIGYALFEGDKLTEWMIMASASDSYENLHNKWIVERELSTHGGTHWSPEMSVPEPSSGILSLIGSLVLCLKRKNRKA